MKKYLTTTMICFALVSLFTGSGCKRYEHKKEEKVIKRERSETEKSISDLNEAILLTDQAGWDSASDYRQFKDTSIMRIQVCQRNIDAFKIKIGKGSKGIPRKYKRKIDRLEQQNKDLEQRLEHFHIKNRSEWEDFTRLFIFDLEQHERSVKQLTRK